jgi:hypothetical protein
MGQRTAVTAAVLSLLASSCTPATAAMPVFARISMDTAQSSEMQSVPEASTSQAPMPVYFGNGCFWGRQKDFVDAEKSLGRSPDQISSVVGYAGGRAQGQCVLLHIPVAPICSSSSKLLLNYCVAILDIPFSEHSGHINGAFLG